MNNIAKQRLQLAINELDVTLTRLEAVYMNGEPSTLYDTDHVELQKLNAAYQNIRDARTTLVLLKAGVK